MKNREEQTQELKNQIVDLRSLRGQLLTQVGDLTVRSNLAQFYDLLNPTNVPN
ncbi:MAG: hypothetical protein R2788_09105 [Saprospiraceae bacterium]